MGHYFFFHYSQKAQNCNSQIYVNVTISTAEQGNRSRHLYINHPLFVNNLKPTHATWPKRDQRIKSLTHNYFTAKKKSFQDFKGMTDPRSIYIILSTSTVGTKPMYFSICISRNFARLKSILRDANPSKITSTFVRHGKFPNFVFTCPSPHRPR